VTGSLAGRTILVTRPRGEADGLARLLRARGARVLVAPAIDVVPAPVGPLDRAISRLLRGEFAWLVLTSQAGVAALAARLEARGATLRSIDADVAAIGEGTARAVRRLRVRPSLVPPTFTTEGLGRAFPKGSGRVLLARADIAPDGLEDAIAAKGWTPERVDAYRTMFARRLPVEVGAALRAGSIDAVTFTSASTVQGFVGMTRRLASDGVRLPRAVCLGPVTSAAARSRELRVAAVARPHTIDGLVEAVERALRPRRPRRSKEP
jgi:uroporphyrinogen-III synthase